MVENVRFIFEDLAVLTDNASSGRSVTGLQIISKQVCKVRFP